MSLELVGNQSPEDKLNKIGVRALKIILLIKEKKTFIDETKSEIKKRSETSGLDDLKDNLSVLNKELKRLESDLNIITDDIPMLKETLTEMVKEAENNQASITSLDMIKAG